MTPTKALFYLFEWFWL